MHATRSVLAIFCVALSASVPVLAGTSFTEVTPAGGSWVTNGDEDFWITSVAPADVDGDGDLDLAALGFHVVYFGDVTHRLVLFENDGAGADGRWSFTEEDVPLGSLWAGASDLAWGDYDNDGDPDLVVASDGAMELYRNDAGTLELTSIPLPLYYEDSEYEGSYDLRSLTWADYDNDGDLDLLVPSVFDDAQFEFSTKLLRNDGAGEAGTWAFTDSGAVLDPTTHAQSTWADDDADDDLDLFLVNVDPFTETGFVKRYRNDGGTFAAQELLDITVEHGSADWGDCDGDGDLDVLVAGNIKESDDTYSTVLRIYRNDGGTFSETTLPPPTPNVPGAWWLDYHAATWADYDSDGDVDLLVSGSYVGESEILGGAEVYENVGCTFSSLGLELPAPIESVGRGGAFTWFDLDDDGDLDYLIAGAYFVPGGSGLVEAQFHLYRNGAPATNAAPTAPQSVSAVATGTDVELSWLPASDDHTPPAALTYELLVQPSETSAVAGERLPEPGNLSAVTSWKLENLTAGSYRWTLRAVDAAFLGGAVVEGSLTLVPLSPPPVPDGTNGGAVRVAKLDPSGSALGVDWDATTCQGAAAYHVVYGVRSQLPSAMGEPFVINRRECAVEPPWTWSHVPDPSSDPARLIWFLVIANDAEHTEGSWGTDSLGVERRGPAPDGSSGVCGISAKSLTNACGP